MRHGVLYYFVADAIADLRAWLWALYADYGQSIALIETDAMAAIRRGKI